LRCNTLLDSFALYGQTDNDELGGVEFVTIITPVGTETLVNTTTTNSQYSGAVTALTGGRYVVVWTDNIVPGGENPSNGNYAIPYANTDVRMQIFNADGTRVGNEILVNTTTAGPQTFARATLLSDGHLLVTWQDQVTTLLGGATSSLRAQEFLDTGVAVGGEFQIGAPGVQAFTPGIASVAGGGFVAFWHQDPNGPTSAIVGQVFNSSNATVGSQFTVDSTNMAFIAAPAATTLANGNVVVAWDNGPTGPSGVSARIYSPTGVAIGPELAIGGPVSAGIDLGTLATITALTTGGFAVSWVYDRPSFNVRYANISVRAADGSILLEDTVASGVSLYGPNAANAISGAAIAPLANGGIIATWQGSDADGLGIRAQAFNGIGNPIGAEFAVNAQTTGTQYGPLAAVLSNGDFVIAWRDGSGAIGDTSGTGVATQRYHVDPTNQTPTAVNDSFIASGIGEGYPVDAYLLSNDVDLDGDALIVTAVTNVTGGTVNFNLASQSFQVTYSSGSTQIGFDYTVSDGAGGTSTAHATLLATRDDFVTVRGNSVPIDFLANDGLSARPQGYSFSLSPPSIGNAILIGTGLATQINYIAPYSSTTGYAVLPVGQTMNTSIIYSVINPTTGLADYNAMVNVTLQGWAQIGGTGADTLTGSALADHLIGGTGAANTLIGGAGNDWYTVQATGDSIVELAGGGSDVVYTSLGVFTLPANVEVLIYTGPGAAFLGLGNAENNFIGGGQGNDDLYGYGGNDTLSGQGGINTMIGGTGDDIYNVSVITDSTIELVGEGIDTVRTAIGIYGLQSNIENLTFINTATHGAGVGNILNNVLTGNIGGDDLFGREGNDTLIGGSGTANTLLGQEGDDLYIVTAAGDSVIEFAGQGIDTVQTNQASFVLRDNVENLTFTGTAAFTGIGAADANTITGGAADDFLSGLDGNDILIGGSGADIMLGGNGADQFRYVGGETGVDRILDFTSGSDKIALLSSFFTPTATVSFVQGAAATTANSTFLYDVATGIVSYDDDGNGAGAAVQIAQLNSGLTLAAGDFIFY
jgi:serralysin